jgi:Zn-dependent protease with chaperone function
MTNEQFEALVGRLEDQARSNPGGYQLRVFLLAMLGSAYMGLMLLLIAALLAALVASVIVLKALAAKPILIVGFFLWTILKALWVKISPPVGSEIKAGQAPELLAMVEGLRRQLGAPRFHHVLITDDFNAGVVQSPRLGIFGWFRNYLLIGLPLMKALTIEQFKAVLAHEFGHLAKGHGRMSNWIYRQRLRWSRLLAMLDASESRGSFLFKPFLTWFAPYFNAYSFPMARANEYEADATSARFTSSQAAAEALTGVNVVGSYLAERYWPQIYKQADEQRQPSFAPYFGMGRRVATELADGSAQAWLDKPMAQQTNSTDTHPALNDRLKAIGEAPHLAPPALGQAADRLLGDRLGTITESFDLHWKHSILRSWEERHREVQDGRRRLAELDTRFGSGAELTVQEAYERAKLTETIGNNSDDALTRFRALHERAPDNAAVCFSLGAHFLWRDDDAGCALVEHVMQFDEDAIAPGCELLRDYHWRNGLQEQAHVWHQRLVERLQLLEAAAKERKRLSLRDKFEHHGLSDEALAELRAQLWDIPGLGKAYFVKKCVKHLAHRPCYVLGYSVTGFLQLHRKRLIQEVLRRIQETVRFPGETLIIYVQGPYYRFGWKFRWVRGARTL